MGSVLVVDDEIDIRDMVANYLTRQSYNCLKAASGEEALFVLRSNQECDIVLTDLSMPGMDGLEMIERTQKELERDVQFVVLTGNGDKEKAVRALRLGVSEFLDKPVSWKSIMNALGRANELSERSRRQSEALRITNILRDRLSISETKLLNSSRMAARQLANVARYKDVETVEHCERVGRYTRKLAQLMGYSETLSTDVELAAILHDIGKVGIPDSILLKTGPLSASEFKVMTRHTVLGAKMLGDYEDNPVLEIAQQIALHHHERWDGTGYPNNLAAERIPVPARICAIADVYDALRSERRYKAGVDHETAVRIMIEGDGRTEPGHFDPELLKIFEDNHKCFACIFESLPDNTAKPLDLLEQV